MPKDTFWHNVQARDADTDKPEVGFNTSEKIEYYSTHADEYDEEQSGASYRSPIMIADALHKYLEGKVDTKILDVAAGTGEVMRLVRKYAPYNNVDGLDAANGMLEIAKQRGYYNNIFCLFFGQNTGIEHNSYDVVCNSGGIGPGHIKMDGFQEMFDIARPGGYVMVSFRALYSREYPDYMDLLPMHHRWQDEGKITILEETVYDDYYPGYDGILLVYKKL